MSCIHHLYKCITKHIRYFNLVILRHLNQPHSIA
jgi:uncharacterized protein (DUF2062 family)